MATRRWVQVVLAVLLVLTLGVIVLAGSCAYLVRQQVRVTDASSPAEFDREVDAVLRRFRGVPALVEDTDSGPRIATRAMSDRQKAVAKGKLRALKNLNVLVFSTRENKLVRLSIPFWLLRMSPDGTVDINDDEVDLGKLRLSIDDLEAAGPGPLFVRRSGDSKVLAWTE
ncbi:hypothetical protein TBR22_A49540 [Luteitalea sp. TBR-22]|uniref:hypothetical protein n=1 Tax=Luteitalea sp. TBR-22 TaxID=2802971 RepID=UPI001AFCB49E|nr:hypothetical protein [Luteitalea sp. TBR-22]BCS35720.1 hypothetical protein TBR22_A49540 [Luteitalea sp. TBR-22]